MFTFYSTEGFKLFPCNVDKTPRVASWRSSETHIDADSADRIAATGNYIGAWLPTNYVVIDIDRGHKEGQDGMPTFLDLCLQNGIEADLTRETLTVKTGSGGLHLYFTLPEGTDYKSLSQKSLADSVDVRTHLGYVIAAGTNGYSVANNARPMELPAPLLTLIQTRNRNKARDYNPAKELPIEILSKILAKIPAEEFSTNDDWQEFVTSCIAVSGNTSEVLDAIEAWSKSDPNYAKDDTVRKRLETFEPDGGITAGTFVHLIKKAGLSKYLVDKVKMAVGAQFQMPATFIEGFEPTIHADFSMIHEHKDLIRAAYYAKNQMAMLELFKRLADGNFMYVDDDKAFYYFDGNRWVEEPGAVYTVTSVLITAGQHWYTDVSKKEDADAADIVSAYVSYLCSVSITQRLSEVLKQYPGIYRKSVDWDSASLHATLTLSDCVMDFSGDRIEFRKGQREEYRLLYIDLSKSDFDNRDAPNAFRAFLKDVFPNEETRKTATFALATMLGGTGKFRKFQIWNGSGRNGKSTLMEIMKYVIGDRAITYKPEILLNKSHVQSLTPELAVFRGALAAFASETEEAKRVSQGSVKALTGNETITANPKYKNMITFHTTFQLVLSTNYLPTFSAHDIAFIDRVLVLPFYTCFYENDEHKDVAQRKGSRYFVPARDINVVMEEVKSERAQILYYLAARYQQLDLSIPESPESLQAKSHYVDDNNDIFQFITDFIEFDDRTDEERGKDYYFTPIKELTDFYNEENNTHLPAKFVSMRIREVYPLVEKTTKRIDGKQARGFKNIRIKYGAYPEGWQGNYSAEEVERLRIESAEF